MAIQENAIGVPIEYGVLNSDGSARNISAATVKKLLFKKPNGVRLEKTANFSNPPGSDGKLVVTTVAGDLVPYGVFEVQAELTFTTSDLRTEIATFPVLRNL
jgi:hypothetical protein